MDSRGSGRGTSLVVLTADGAKTLLEWSPRAGSVQMMIMMMTMMTCERVIGP